MKFKSKKQRKAVMSKLVVRGLPKDDPFVINIRNSLEQLPPEKNKMIKRVTVEKSKNNYEPLGRANVERNSIIMRKTKELTLDEYDPIFQHEVDHIWFNEEIKSNPENVQTYVQEIRNIKPFSSDLERIEKEIFKAKEEKNKRKVRELVAEYIDEFHSQTKELVERNKIGLDTKHEDPKGVKLAIRAYNRLHRK